MIFCTANFLFKSYYLGKSEKASIKQQLTLVKTIAFKPTLGKVFDTLNSIKNYERLSIISAKISELHTI